jgi:hypothetical protein
MSHYLIGGAVGAVVVLAVLCCIGAWWESR